MVTASGDHTGQVWVAATGKPFGVPLRHGDGVKSAQFSSDDQRLVTSSVDRTARVWDVPTSINTTTDDTILLLAELAEVTGGKAFESAGQAEILTTLPSTQGIAARQEIAKLLADEAGHLTELERFLKWSVTDRQSRTISSFSNLSLAGWIENRMKESPMDDLREAMQVALGNPHLTARLGGCLADLAIDPKTDPDEARLAKGDGDFLTRHALKLDPSNAEIQKFSGEVEKLLSLAPATP